MEISKKFIDDINGCIWLEKCGEENIEQLDFPLQLIENLKDAEKHIESLEWENVCLEKRGDFTAYLSKNHKMDYNKFWNKQIRSIKTEFLPQIEDKIAIAIRKKGMKESVLKDIKFNLLTLFMLDFYSDYYSDSFFENMLQIYLAGHFPCGWNEKDGFIVY